MLQYLYKILAECLGAYVKPPRTTAAKEADRIGAKQELGLHLRIYLVLYICFILEVRFSLSWIYLLLYSFL